MHFSGTDILVKLHNAPYTVPRINSTFTFPSTRIKVIIEDGKLIYNTFDGRGAKEPLGFCSDPAFTNMSDCLSHASGPGKWTPFATLGNSDDIARINLNGHHIILALNEMLEYFKTNAVNNEDYIALEKWTMDIKSKAVEQASFSGGIDKKARLIDVSSIQFNNQQPVTPLYGTHSPYMETYMKSNTMIQGSILVNFAGDTRNPAHTYFKGKPFKKYQQMIGNMSFIDDRTLGSLITQGKYDTIGLDPDDHMVMEIIFLRDEFERYYGLNTDEYMMEQGTTTVQLHDVRFISRNHSVSPAAENIVEQYQFIAREII